MEISEMKKILEEIEEINFRKHFYEDKVQLRGITEEEIKQFLKRLNKLIVVDDQEKAKKDTNMLYCLANLASMI